MAQSCGTLTVIPEFSAGNLAVESCSIASTSLSPGESTSVAVIVENTNVQPASATVVVTVDGQMVTSGSVSVGARSTQRTTLSFSAPNAEGDYETRVTLTDVAQSAPRSSRSFAGFGSLLSAPARFFGGCSSCGTGGS